MILSVLGAAAMVLGATTMAIAALGLVRLPDVYSRLSATSKAAPVGAALLVLGASLVLVDPGVALRGALALAVLSLSAPVAAQALARAAHRSGVEFAPGTRRED